MKWTEICLPTSMADTRYFSVVAMVSIMTLTACDHNQQLIVNRALFGGASNSVSTNTMTIQLVPDGAGSCAGVAGSVLPPFTGACSGFLAVHPLSEFANGFSNLFFGVSVQNDPLLKHVRLNGIEKYWVAQENSNYCWAAALQITRRYLHLPEISQENIVSLTQNMCPLLKSQKQQTDMYQFLTAFVALYPKERQADKPQIIVNPIWIIDDLQHNKPVIMLRDGHAVVVVGADYSEESLKSHGYVNAYHILDPDPRTNGKVALESPLYICNADALVGY